MNIGASALPNTCFLKGLAKASMAILRHNANAKSQFHKSAVVASSCSWSSAAREKGNLASPLGKLIPSPRVAARQLTTEAEEMRDL